MAASIGELLKCATSFADRLRDPGQRLARGTVKNVVRRPITKAWNEAKKHRRLSALLAWRIRLGCIVRRHGESPLSQCPFHHPSPYDGRLQMASLYPEASRGRGLAELPN